MMKQNILPFISPQRIKWLLMRVILMMYFNESMVRLYQKIQIISCKRFNIMDSIVNHNTNISKHEPHNW